MTKVIFEEKYLEERKVISREKEVDMGVATEMLIAHVKNRNVETPYKYNFTGCENLNYEEMDNEIQEMEEAAAKLRKEYGLE